MSQHHEDEFADAVELAAVSAAIIAGAATTEFVVFDTTRINRGLIQQALAPFKVRRQGGHLRRAWITVFSDQGLTLYFRHLSGQVASPADADFKDVITPVTVTASTAKMQPLHFSGDDHRIILKTGGTPPTVLQISLRFSSDQALAE